jgi:hypothetical protein
MTTTSEWGDKKILLHETNSEGLNGLNIKEIGKIGESGDAEKKTKIENNIKRASNFTNINITTSNNTGNVDIDKLDKEKLNIIIKNITTEQEEVSVEDCNYLLKASILSDKYIKIGGQAFALLLVRKGFNKAINKNVIKNGVEIIEQFKKGKTVVGSFGELEGKIKFRWDGERVRFNISNNKGDI